MTSERLWARWLNVLHLPFTIWHISYVAMGAAMAEEVRWGLLGWTSLSFFLGMGVGAHCLDLLKGDPLALRLPRRHLVFVGANSLAAAAGIGIAQVLLGNVPVWMVGVAAVGLVLAIGYNMEIRWMHGDVQFALMWAVFPFLVGHLAMSGTLSTAILPLSVFSFLTAYAQRVLSTRSRYLRRKVDVLEGSFASEEPPPGLLKGEGKAARERGIWGPLVEFDERWILEPIESTLLVLGIAMPLLAGGLLLWRA